MGLLTVPTIPLGPPASVVLVGAANKRIGDGVVIAKGMVFAGTNSGLTPENLFRWTNLYNPGGYDTLAPSSFFLSSISMASVDLIHNCVYFGSVNFDGGAGTNDVTVVKTDIDAFTDGGEVIPQTALSTAAFNDLGFNSGMCNDGTFIYVLGNDLVQNSWIGKFLISDGSLVTALQLGNPPSNTSKGGSLCAFGGDGFIYLGGSLAGNAWVGRVDTALTSATLINVPIGTINDDCVLDSSYFWVGDETTTTPGNLVRVNRDMSGFTQFTTGIEGWIDCIYQDPDDLTKLWLVQNYSRPVGGLQNASALVLWDKTLGLQWVYRTSMLFDLNEIFKMSNAAMFGVTFNASSATNKSRAGVMPLFSDPGLTAMVPGGRGAGW